MSFPEPGQLAQIDDEHRLCIPADVLRAVRWWKKETVEVTAELVEEGLVRIYLGEEARPLVKTLAEDVAGLTNKERYERAAVLSDRYRDLKLYAECRLRLTKDVAHVLGISWGDRTSLFVRPIKNGMEIMSLKFRLDRLANNPISVGLHYDDENS